MKGSTAPGNDAAPPLTICAVDGRRLSPADAKSEGIVIRSSCERCRKRKVACAGISGDAHACTRCTVDGAECIFVERSPSGRPPKHQLVQNSDISRKRRTSHYTDQNFPQYASTNGHLPDPHASLSVNGMLSETSCCGEPTASQVPRKNPMSIFTQEFDPQSVSTGLLPSGNEMQMSGLSMPPAAMELGTSPGSNASQSSLSDLSLAAFLESMYTLEIAPSDGLTASMLSPEGMLDKAANLAAGEKGLSPDSAQMASQSQMPPQQQSVNALSTQGQSGPGDMRFEQEEGFAKSAFLQDNLSYSVPSDLRWWDLAWSFPPAEEPESSEDRSESVSVSEEKPGGFPTHGDHAQAPMPPPEPRNELQTQAHSCCANKGISAHEVNPASDVQVDTQGYKLKPHHEVAQSAGMNSTCNTASSHAGKVHCVPNPNGPGCTCQCDTGMALLNLKRDLDNAPLQTDGSAKAASTLRFTLSSSREVARQCQCSADCPTCKQDPSKQISASLLISTALQIYARALQILREVLVTDGSRKCSSDGCRCQSLPCECSKNQSGAHRGASIVDVQVGGFIPSPINSRKIALYAMKLELYDLERALARVCDTAKHSRLASTSTSVETIQGLAPKGESALRVNPLDQLVLRKLHQQLSELLHTIENMTS